MKILFCEVRHFSPNFHEVTGSKTIFAFFSQKIGEKKIVKTVSGFYKNKKKTKKKSGTDH